MRRQRLVNGFFDGDMRLMQGASQVIVLLNRARDQMRVRLQPLRHDAARIAVAVLIFHYKVLREQLKHHAVFAKLYLPGAIQRAIDIALLNFPRTAELDTAAAVRAPHGSAAETDYRGVN